MRNTSVYLSHVPGSILESVEETKKGGKVPTSGLVRVQDLGTRILWGGQALSE